MSILETEEATQERDITSVVLKNSSDNWPGEARLFPAVQESGAAGFFFESTVSSGYCSDNMFNFEVI